MSHNNYIQLCTLKFLLNYTLKYKEDRNIEVGFLPGHLSNLLTKNLIVKWKQY